jgi:hypothetical protein
MVQTGLLPGRQFSEAVFPENDFAAIALCFSALLQRLPVLTRRAPQRFIESASFAVIIGRTVFVPHHAGLLPETGVQIFGMCFFQAS